MKNLFNMFNLDKLKLLNKLDMRDIFVLQCYTWEEVWRVPVKEFEKTQIHSFIEPTDLKRNLHLVINNAFVETPTPTFAINNRRYLGNKFKLNEFIYHNIISECGDFSSFADLFAGTGSVASLFQDKQLIVNDILYSNYVCHQTWFGTDKFSKSKIIKYLNQYNTSKVSRDN